jgi:hypothetical protein
LGRCDRGVESEKVLPSHELFVVDAVGALDLAIVLRHPRLDVAMSAARLFERENKVQEGRWR